MAQGFREIVKEFKDSQRETNAKLKNDIRADKEKRELKKKEIKAEFKEGWNEFKQDTEEIRNDFRKTGNEFNEIRENFKSDTLDLKNEYKEKQEVNKIEYAELKANRPKGFERMKNTMMTGLALWLAMPLIIFILIVGILVSVGLWDWFTGLFS